MNERIYNTPTVKRARNVTNITNNATTLLAENQLFRAKVTLVTLFYEKKF